ncbi:hypothetical protein ACFVGM_08905 [Kitasatospora purpeofusca]|uniref:hypothetical protein n=1 Tax=Kitasatospora purpeofusca TaxID=67352 RepID=UPI00369ECFA0
MADVTGTIKRIRSELGDFGSPFRDDFLGGDELSTYDLSETGVTTIVATLVTGDPPQSRVLVQDVDYALDVIEGRIVLLGANGPLRHGQRLVVTGTSGGMFTDAELEMYIADAMAQHGHGQTVRTRYRDDLGWIRYWEEPVTLENLPEVQEPMVAWLAAVQALWTLATDAATDTDISTADGTFLPRTQRYRQIMEHIGELTGRYSVMAQQLNVGLGRIEMMTLRRVSRTTGRLVPVFRSREYDDTSVPQRVLPPVDGQPLDESGLPSPLYPGLWG